MTLPWSGHEFDSRYPLKGDAGGGIFPEFKETQRSHLRFFIMSDVAAMGIIQKGNGKFEPLSLLLLRKFLGQGCVQ